jgi:hypothetical protein
LHLVGLLSCSMCWRYNSPTVVFRSQLRCEKICAPVGCRPALAARVMKRALPYFLALAVILTARQATTIDKPLSAEAWRAFGIEALTGL